MLFASYALFVAIAALPLLFDPRARSRPAELMLMGVAVVIAGAAGLIAAMLLVDRDEPTTTATILLTGLLIGSIAFVLGAIVSRGRAALSLRAVGWLFMVITTGFPSTLTLALPLLAVLSFTLVPSQRTDSVRSRRSIHVAG